MRYVSPKADMSRELARVRTALRRPPTRKSLYFRSAHLLENLNGDRFGLLMKCAKDRGYAYVMMERPMQEPGAYIDFEFPRSKNYVKIETLHSVPNILKPVIDYSIPKPELRGYGFLQIAIFLAASIAKKHGRTEISISPSSREVASYYESWGFAPLDETYEQMLFPLKKGNP